MYELFLGNYEEALTKTVYYKKGKKYIPCCVTNYYFKSKKYTLVPLEDIEKFPVGQHSKRRLYTSEKIYVKK